MTQSPQTIQVNRDGVVHEATLSWWRTADYLWTVSIASSAFETTEARADDAFEALCIVRGDLEPHGWRIGVVGAQIDVWPSGMARDQGGGLRAYRMTPDGVQDMVDTFEPADPATVVTVAEQRTESDRLYEEIRRNIRNG